MNAIDRTMLLNEIKRYARANNYALLIYFTDGAGEAIIPQPIIYKSLWVLTYTKETFSVTEPYGEIIEMNLEDNLPHFGIANRWDKLVLSAADRR